MEKQNSFRSWLRTKVGLVTLYSTALGGVLTVIIAWGQLDLPRPATYSEVQAVAETVASNTQLILGDRWFRLKARLRTLEAKLRRDPGNRELIEEITRVEQQLREVNKKLDRR